MLRGMSFRSSSSSSSFSAWLENQNQRDSTPERTEESQGLLSQLSSIQDGVLGQLQELSGVLPDANLGAAYRARLLQAIYLLAAALGFALLAIFVGIPTLVVRPSKFVLCLTLCTLCATSSVIVLQKPSVFIQELLSAGFDKKFPVIALFLSAMITLYVTVFIHKYLQIIVMGALQVLCLLWYLTSFIPGGSRGLQLILRMLMSLISTTLRPMLFLLRKSLGLLLRNFSSSA